MAGQAVRFTIWEKIPSPVSTSRCSSSTAQTSHPCSPQTGHFALSSWSIEVPEDRPASELLTVACAAGLRLARSSLSRMVAPTSFAARRALASCRAFIAAASAAGMRSSDQKSRRSVHLLAATRESTTRTMAPIARRSSTESTKPMCAAAFRTRKTTSSSFGLYWISGDRRLAVGTANVAESVLISVAPEAARAPFPLKCSRPSTSARSESREGSIAARCALPEVSQRIRHSSQLEVDQTDHH